MSPPYFPITPEELRGDGRVPGGRQRRLRGQRREGAVALGAPHRPDARVPGRDRGRVGRVPLRPRARARCPTTPTTTSPTTCSSSATASTCSSTTRSTPPTSTSSSALGSLHDRVRGARRQGGGRPRARAVPPLPVARRRPARHHPARRPRAVGRASTDPRCSPPPTGCATSSGRRTAEPRSTRARRIRRDRARPRRHAVPLRARALRHRRHHHHRDGRRRAGRHGRQLVHVAVARPAARALLRRAHVVDTGRASSAPAPSRSTSSARTTRSCRTCSPRRAPTASVRPRGACGVSGAPVLEEAIAYLDCRFEAEYPGGDHKIIVGRVLDLDMREGSRPLLFYKGGYSRMHDA